MSLRRSFAPDSGASATAATAAPVIAVVTDAIYPFHMGGKEVRYRHVIAGLAATGATVRVFTMHWWDGPRRRHDGGVEYLAICRKYPLYNASRRSIVEAVMFSLACLRLLGQRFDVIEADHMPHLQLFTIGLVARLRRVPLVVTWHEYWGAEYWRTYLGRAGALAALVESRAVRIGDHFITPSPETAVRLEQRGIPATRISVVPNGLDLDAIDAAAPSERAVGVLYVGRLLAHKHVDWLLEALASLRDRGTALTCAVVGEGPERPRLEEQARAHGLAESVTFLGNVEDQGQIYGLMKAASVFALPSTREGFGIVVAEAIACGTPVVTTDHPDNHSQSLLREGVTGRICHASPTALADAIVDAIAISETSVRSERPALEGLSWSAGAKRIFDVLTAELDARRPAVHRA